MRLISCFRAMVNWAAWVSGTSPLLKCHRHCLCVEACCQSVFCSDKILVEAIFGIIFECTNVMSLHLFTFNKWRFRYFAQIYYPQEMINGPDSTFIFTIPVCNLIRSRVPLMWAAGMNRWRAVTIDEWIDKYMDLGYNGCLLFLILMRMSQKRHRALSSPFWVFQLSGARRWKWKKSWLLGNEHRTPRGLCDRWQARLGGSGCWRSARRRLTVACCFSARSFASSSCFCKAAWRDFISSLSNENEERNRPLAHLPQRPGTQWPS